MLYDVLSIFFNQFDKTNITFFIIIITAGTYCAKNNVLRRLENYIRIFYRWSSTKIYFNILCQLYMYICTDYHSNKYNSKIVFERVMGLLENNIFSVFLNCNSNFKILIIFNTKKWTIKCRVWFLRKPLTVHLNLFSEIV